MEDIQRDDSSLKTDWALKETPRERGSCLQLGFDGQCVNKAVALLSALKEHLTTWRHHSQKQNDRDEKKRTTNINKKKNEYQQCPSISESPSQSPPARSHPSSAITFRIPTRATLSVEGTQICSTNETRRVFDWSNVEDIISHSLSLVIRLEDDRSNTVRLWEEERERVKKMRKRLDEKAAERLMILPLLVQQEHEQCMRDLIELKWHVSFEKRQLEHIRDDAKIIDDDNHQYQEEISETNDILLLLQEKFQVEGDKMAAIIHQQTMTAEELKKRKEDLNRVQEVAHQTRVRVSNEKKHMDRMLDELKARLNQTFETLNNAQLEQAALTHKINSARTSITDNKREKGFKDEELNGLTQKKTDIEKQVMGLKELNAKVDKDIQHLKERNLSLRKRKQENHASLDAEQTVLISDTQKWNKELKNIRQRNEDMICEMNEMKEQTHASERRYADDIKSVERARKELQKIDKQLQVVHSQTETIRKEHIELTQCIKDDELKLGNLEDQLRSTVQGLKEELQKEMKTKMSYQGKIEADEADLEKMKVEHKRKEENVNETAREIEVKKNSHHEAMDRLLEAHKEKLDQEGKLKEDVRKALQELTQVEKELGEKHSILTLKEDQLSKETGTKCTKAKNLKERVELLKDRIIDTKKSQETVERMEHDIKTIIERLEVTKADLLERISFEKEQEESWKREFEEISEFSRQANERYTSYLVEREEYFSQLERDAITAIKENRELGEKYETLRDIHVDVKTKALIVMEHRLELEAALKDMGQLLALQTALSSTMKAYYEHRGAKSRLDLASFARNAATSYKNVEKLQKQFELVLSDIDGFLNKHTSAQVQLISKHRGGSGQKDEGMTNNGREMRKAVSQEMSGQSHHHKRLLLTNGEINSERRDIIKTELPPITSAERSSPKSVTFNLPVQCSS